MLYSTVYGGALGMVGRMDLVLQVRDGMITQCWYANFGVEELP